MLHRKNRGVDFVKKSMKYRQFRKVIFQSTVDILEELSAPGSAGDIGPGQWEDIMNDLASLVPFAGDAALARIFSAMDVVWRENPSYLTPRAVAMKRNELGFRAEAPGRMGIIGAAQELLRPTVSTLGFEKGNDKRRSPRKYYSGYQNIMDQWNQADLFSKKGKRRKIARFKRSSLYELGSFGLYPKTIGRVVIEGSEDDEGIYFDFVLDGVVVAMFDSSDVDLSSLSRNNIDWLNKGILSGAEIVGIEEWVSKVSPLLVD